MADTPLKRPTISEIDATIERADYEASPETYAALFVLIATAREAETWKSRAETARSERDDARRERDADAKRLDWWFDHGMEDSVCEGSVDLWWATEVNGDATTVVTHGTSLRDTLDKAMRGEYESEESHDG